MVVSGFGGENMKILIIGCGRLGSHCAQQLYDAGHEIIGVKRRPSDEQAYPWSMHYADAEHVDFFISLAAEHNDIDTILVTANPGFRQHDESGNGLQGIMHHISHYYPHAQLIYTSSTYVYGDKNGQRVTESDASAHDQRARRLLAIEHAAEQQAHAIILRISALHSDQRQFLRQRILASTDFFDIRGPMKRHFNYCHDDDAATVLCLAVQGALSNGVYNVSAPDTLSYEAYCLHCIAEVSIAEMSITEASISEAKTLALREISQDQPDRLLDAQKLYACLPCDMRWTLLSGAKVRAPV